MADEVMMPVPTIDALRQSEVAAMRQISDVLSFQGRTMEKLVDRVEQLRDKVIQIEAQGLKSSIQELRIDFEKCMREIKAAQEADVVQLRVDLKEANGRIEANARSIERIRGIFLPLAVLGSAFLAFVGEYAANTMTFHH